MAHQPERPEPEFVSLRDVYRSTNDLRKEIGDNFASKSELRMWVAFGILGGQTASAMIAAFLKVGPVGPAAQAAWVYGRVRGWV